MLQMLISRTLRDEDSLRTRFLGDVPPTPAPLSDENFEMIAAYTVLTHATLEHYFECTAKYASNIAFNNFKNTKKFNNIISNISIYSASPIKVPSKLDKKDHLTSHVTKSVRQFSTDIGNSHGIKEEALTNLFTRIGFDLHPHNTLIAECEELGKYRGAFAHTTTRVAKNKTSIDPRTTLVRITNIFQMLQNFSDELDKYIKSNIS